MDASTAVTKGERIALTSPRRRCVCRRRGHYEGRELIEHELAPDTRRAEAVKDSPCLAELVDEQQPEAASALRVRREDARSQA